VLLDKYLCFLVGFGVPCYYFLDEQVNGITSYYIKHIDEVNTWCITHNKAITEGFTIKQFNNKGIPCYDKNAHIKSYELITLME
jgi:hypothetical protein